MNKKNYQKSLLKSLLIFLSLSSKINTLENNIDPKYEHIQKKRIINKKIKADLNHIFTENIKTKLKENFIKAIERISEKTKIKSRNKTNYEIEMLHKKIKSKIKGILNTILKEEF